MAFRKLTATESWSCYRLLWFQRYERVAWGLPCLYFELKQENFKCSSSLVWDECKCGVWSLAFSSSALLPPAGTSCGAAAMAESYRPHFRKQLVSQLTFILIYFLPCESLVCESWSSVLIGLLLHFRSFHLTVDSAGNPVSIIRGKNVEVIVVVVWSEADMTWAWNFKISSIYRSCCTGMLLENWIVSFFPHWSSRLSKLTAMWEGFWYTFSFEKFSIALSEICTRILPFWSSFYRFCMHSGTQDCSKTLCRSSCFSSTCSLVD